MVKAHEVTALSGVRLLGSLKKYHHIPGFSIGGTYEIGNPQQYEFGGAGGVPLESLGAGPLRTAYIAVGNPKRDNEGKITNAVIISSYYGGDAALGYYFWYEGQAGNFFSLWPVVGPGRIIDTDRFYVIFLDALGLWGASKPSDGLGMKFPHYTIFDCVQANYRLLKDALNVGRVQLATGLSMGAIQTYAWAVLHPEFVEAIMPIGGSTSTRKDPVLRWAFELMTAAMKSDPLWRQTAGNYYHLPKDQHPNQGIMFGWSILLHNGMDLDFRIEQGWEEVQKEVFSWEPEGDQGALLRQKARDYDCNDLIIRNSSQDRFDVDAYLSGIICPALIIHCKNDLWLRIKLAQRSAACMPAARFAPYEHHFAHYSLFRAPHIVKDEVQAFMDQIKQ